MLNKKRAEQFLRQQRKARIQRSRKTTAQKRKSTKRRTTSSQERGKTPAEAISASTESDFAAQYDLLPIGVVVFDTVGRIQQINSAATEILRWERRRALQFPFTFLVASDEMRRFVEHLRLCRMGQGRTVTTELHIKSQENLIPVRISSVGVKSGRRMLYWTTILDLSDLRRFEAAEKASAAFAESIVDSIGEPLLVLTHDLIIVSVNKSFCQTFGASPHDAQGRPLEWLLDPSCDSSELRRHLAAVWQEQRPLENFLLECELAGNGGRLMTLSARRIPRGTEQPDLLLVTLQDVTDQKRIEEEFKRNQRLLEDFIQNAPVGVHWASAEGRILSANRAELDMFGYTRDEYVGHLLREFYIDTEAVEELFSKLMRHETVEQVEMRVRCKDGRIKYVAVSANVSWENDKFIHTRCFTRDITERKRAEESIRQMNQLLESRVEARTRELHDSHQEMEAFCYTIAHDLRAPLRAMEGFANALLEDYGAALEPEGQEYARRIVAAARREDRLIQDLLEYNQLRLATLACGPAHLDAILDSAIAALRTEIDSREAFIQIVPDLPEVVCHAPTLQRMLVHLILNAVKFVAEGVRPQVKIWAERKAASVRLWVEDNGIGIARQHHQRIFRVFERLHSIEGFPGTGIGLALVAKGAEKMQGTVGVESQPGAGSRFWVELRDAHTLGEQPARTGTSAAMESPPGLPPTI